jgi:hypothetical protein
LPLSTIQNTSPANPIETFFISKPAAKRQQTNSNGPLKSAANSAGYWRGYLLAIRQLARKRHISGQNWRSGNETRIGAALRNSAPKMHQNPKRHIAATQPQFAGPIDPVVDRTRYRDGLDATGLCV